MSKPRVIKDYEKLDEGIQEQIKLSYPKGFEKHLIKFPNREGKMVSALPFETDDKYYLVRMTVAEAQEIVREDDDYDEYGKLREDVKEVYEEKYDEDLGDDFELTDPDEEDPLLKEMNEEED